MDDRSPLFLRLDFKIDRWILCLLVLVFSLSHSFIGLDLDLIDFLSFFLID